MTPSTKSSPSGVSGKVGSGRIREREGEEVDIGNTGNFSEDFCVIRNRNTVEVVGGPRGRRYSIEAVFIFALFCFPRALS